MAKITLDNVTKSFTDNKAIIEKLSLTIEDGEFVALLGPTGSGKSAIIRLIAGLDEVTDGSILIDDKLANTMLPIDRNVAVVFQNQQLLPSSVYDNIAFSLKLRKKSSEEINIRAREIARILDIDGVLNRKPKSLTALERQRVTWARAFVRDPNVCLFDDSFASLDENLTKRVRSELVKLQYRLKATVVFATRDQIDALTMASKIVVMNDGKIEQIGTPKEIYLSPKTVFVASYVGSPQIAMSTGALIKDGDDICVETCGAKIKLASEKVSAIKNIDEYLSGEKGVTVAIRPENMAIADDGEISAVIEGMENYGAYKVVTLKLSEKTINEWSIVLQSEVENLSVGQEVSIKVDADKIHIFDQMSEETVFSN